jgi:hypothetical protein
MSNFLIDDDTNLLAAEFVLGTLDSEERANAQSLLRIDHRFIAMVKIWERRLSELHLMVEPVEPGAEVLVRIKAKLAELPPGEGPAGAPGEDTAPALESEAVRPDLAPEPPSPIESPAQAASPSPVEPKPSAADPASAAATEAPAAGAEKLPPAPDLPAPAPDAEQIGGKGESDIDVRLPETVMRSERGAEPRAEEAPSTPPPPPSAPPPRLPAKPPDLRPEKQPEPAIKVVRSRSRWRAFSLLLLVLVAALAGLVGAWRFAPDRVPPALQPGPVMTAIGIGTPAPPAARPDPDAFDE